MENEKFNYLSNNVYKIYKRVIIDLNNSYVEIISVDETNKDIVDTYPIENPDKEKFIKVILSFLKVRAITHLYYDGFVFQTDGLFIKYDKDNKKHKDIVDELIYLIYKEYLSELNNIFKYGISKDICIKSSDNLSAYSIYKERLLDVDEADKTLFNIVVSIKEDYDNLKDIITHLVNLSKSSIITKKIANYFDEEGYLFVIDDSRIYCSKDKNLKWINYIIENHNNVIGNKKGKTRKLKMEE